jgi:hypothetical protein
MHAVLSCPYIQYPGTSLHATTDRSIRSRPVGQAPTSTKHQAPSTGNVGVTADQNNWNTNAPNPDAMNTSRQSAGANGANAGARVAASGGGGVTSDQNRWNSGAQVKRDIEDRNRRGSAAPARPAPARTGAAAPPPHQTAEVNRSSCRPMWTGAKATATSPASSGSNSLLETMPKRRIREDACCWWRPRPVGRQGSVELG